MLLFYIYESLYNKKSRLTELCLMERIQIHNNPEKQLCMPQHSLKLKLLYHENDLGKIENQRAIYYPHTVRTPIYDSTMDQIRYLNN